MAKKSSPLGNGNDPSKTSGVSRRQFLKLSGAAVVGAGAFIPGLNLLLHDGAEAKSQENQNRRLRRWGMIIDLRRCDGCRSVEKPPQCTTACIEGHFVPEPQQWIEVFEFDLPGGGTQFVPVRCMHCQNAPCVSVCPVGATWITPEGVTLIDQKRCIGCRYCMAACPYDRRFFNWGDPPVPPEALFVEYSPEHQVPAQKGTVMKCDSCAELARAGRVPFCVQACPHKAMYWGDLEEDLATNGEKVVKFSRFLSNNQAYRLKEHLNTEPRTYFIPGHGQDVGRNPYEKGRMPTEWPWMKRVEGAKTWSR